MDIHVNTSGPSLSLGPKGTKLNVGPQGTYINLKTPVPGLYYNKKIFGKSESKESPVYDECPFCGHKMRKHWDSCPKCHAPLTGGESANEEGFRNPAVFKGECGFLADYLEVECDFSVVLSAEGNVEYDCVCFGLDSAGKLSDDRYMIFYNQPQSPANEITFTSFKNRGKFTVKLGKLPSGINKLVFALCIDGQGTIKDIYSQSTRFYQGGKIYFG